MQGGKRKQLKPKMWGVNPTNGQVGNGKGLKITTFNDVIPTTHVRQILLKFFLNFFLGKRESGSPIVNISEFQHYSLNILSPLG